MKILLDECIDWRLAREIAGHEVATARQMGWTTIKNGELLKLATDAGFEAFVTVDRNLSFQQNIPALSLAVIVLRASSNRLAALKLLVPNLLAALNSAKPGTTVFVSVS
jgi:predicted nuclease of predicted toxin-antitoxin system